MVRYSLYRKVKAPGKRVRFERIGRGAYHKADAIRIFQDRLIAGEGELRPIKSDDEPIVDTVGSRGETYRAASVQAECGECRNHHHERCLRGDCTCACRRYQRATNYTVCQCLPTPGSPLCDRCPLKDNA